MGVQVKLDARSKDWFLKQTICFKSDGLEMKIYLSWSPAIKNKNIYNCPCLYHYSEINFEYLQCELTYFWSMIKLMILFYFIHFFIDMYNHIV